jgi:hypothetical protein
MPFVEDQEPMTADGLREAGPREPMDEGNAALMAQLDQEQTRWSGEDADLTSGRHRQTARRWHLRTIKEVKHAPVQLDLVRGLFPAGPSIVLVYGESSVGKSFWVSSVAFAVALAERWNNRRTRKTGVVYISSEGRMGLRIQAYEKAHGVSLDDAPFRLLETGLDLSDANCRDIDLLIEAVHELDIPVGVLVIDTLARNFGGGDPDKSGDMSTFVEACGRFARAFDAVVIAVHHPGKDTTKGPRNSYALTAGVDAQIVIKAEGDVRLVEVQKQRDGKTETAEAFRLDVVDLGPHPDPDADADERLTSCVAVPVDAVPTPARGRRLPAVAGMARDILSEAIGEAGEAMPQTSTIPAGMRAIQLAEWRRRFYVRYGTDKGMDKPSDATRRAFNHAKASLLAANAIGISDPMVWLWN